MSKSVIDCFMLEPSDQQVVSLRRYVGFKEEGPCPTSGVRYHTANVEIIRAPYDDAPSGDLHPHIDPRWPMACGCGHVFLDEDHWSRDVRRLYRRSDTGELVTLHNPPVGAMWFAPWHEDNYKGPDGQCLVVQTPSGDWVIDGRSSKGEGWTRTGTPPLVTAKPSIFMNPPDGYHGHLTNGQLVEC